MRRWTHWTWRVVLITAALVLGLGLGACGGDKKCGESCHVDMDCKGSMRCIKFINDRICAPKGCWDCAHTCYFDIDPETGKCIFVDCDLSEPLRRQGVMVSGPSDPRELAEQLLEQFLPTGADPKTPEEDGALPFHKLAHANNSKVFSCELELAQLLLDRGAEVEPAEVKHFTPLQTALWQGRNRLARFMLEHGADPNRQDPHDGRTPLLNLHDWPNLEGIRLLVEFGADPDLQDKHGNAALISSIRRGKYPIADLLLDLGASVDIVNSAGMTPITQALHNKEQGMAARLIGEGADLSVQEPWMVQAGTTVLLRIIQLGWSHLAITCLEHGAEAHVLDARRYTALHWAVIKDLAEVVTTLLELGVDTQVRTVNDLTALDFAWRCKNARMVQLLGGQP